MARIGYARVSTLSQSLDVQFEKLEAAGCDLIRSEKKSGASRDNRPELATIIDFSREGDEVVTLRADRLGRDTRECLNVIHELDVKGVAVEILEPGVKVDKTLNGRIAFMVLCMVAEIELFNLKERQIDGIERAKRKGVYKGGKRRHDHEEIRRRLRNNERPVDIARETGVSRSTVYRERDKLKKAGEGEAQSPAPSERAALSSAA